MFICRVSTPPYSITSRRYACVGLKQLECDWRGIIDILFAATVASARGNGAIVRGASSEHCRPTRMILGSLAV